jgi:hypothetical protein
MLYLYIFHTLKYKKMLVINEKAESKTKKLGF